MKKIALTLAALALFSCSEKPRYHKMAGMQIPETKGYESSANTFYDNKDYKLEVKLFDRDDDGNTDLLLADTRLKKKEVRAVSLFDDKNLDGRIDMVFTYFGNGIWQSQSYRRFFRKVFKKDVEDESFAHLLRML